ncbi:MAG: R.Pab1 family restriction endonuclease [Candidatus Firestonebacteria bacterium]
MEYNVKGRDILITIPAANYREYRFNKRKNRLDFGETFSTRKSIFDEQVYLEWQIGYDVLVNEVEKGEKKTKLDKKDFLGSNGKRKYPSQLSEIFYAAIELDLISNKEVNHLLDEIRGYQGFIDEKTISVEHHSKLTINGINFEETSIKLPTLFMIETIDETQIEVSIKKQQYATGVQPMVYFCIPIQSFMNSSYLLGKSSVSGDNLIYVINKNNVQNLISLMKIFGMASKRHNYDIVQIIQTLREIHASK